MKKIKIVTYNLGYGHFNEEYFHGKKLNRKTLAKNIREQIKILKEIDADIILTQESNKLMVNNKLINLFRIQSKELSNYHGYYYSNLNVLNVINIGNATFTKEPTSSYPIVTPFKLNNWVQNKFLENRGSIVTSITTEGKRLVVINIHFAAYEKNKKFREKQIGYIFERALKERMLGNYVIIGGDFNHRFGVDESVIDGYEKLGWQLAVPKEGTHRSCKTKFDQDCKLSTIDGFICSDNIIIKKIKSSLNFKASDHSPVILEIELSEY